MHFKVLTKLFVGLVGLSSFFLFFTFLGNIEVAQAGGWNTGLEIVKGSNTGLSEASLGEVILYVLKWLLSLIFVLAILAFVISGIMFIMSGGQQSIIERAKDWLTYAIIGLVVSILGFAIIYTISRVLTGRWSGSGSYFYWRNGRMEYRYESEDGQVFEGSYDPRTGQGDVRVDTGNVDVEFPVNTGGNP